MGTYTAFPDAAVEAAASRHDLAVDLTDLAVYLEVNPDAEMPDGRTLHKRVYGLTYGDRVTEIYRIAASWGAVVEHPEDGTLIARRVFGSITLAAVLSPPDASLADYHARIAQRDTGTEDAA